MKSILISANSSWYIYNFRINLIKALLDLEYSIEIVSPFDAYSSKLENAGCNFYSLELDNKGINPVKELRTLYKYYKIYMSIKPTIALHFTPKPNIYGSLVSRILKIRHINNIAGLGSAFQTTNTFTRIVKTLYNISQKRAYRIFFQNIDDFELFTYSNIVPKSKAILLPGSGVDVDWFKPRKRINEVDGVNFLLSARLIWEKGIKEYFEAAKMVKAEYPNAQFYLLGFIDANNPNAIEETQINEWHNSGIIKWLGRKEDVRPVIAQSDVIVLPSYYREGTPRSLLEGAAMSKPIITTDNVGCRNVVDDNYNGLICRPRDPIDLAEKMKHIIKIGDMERKKMGLRGRRKMIKEYDEKIVIDNYLKAIMELGSVTSSVSG